MAENGRTPVADTQTLEVDQSRPQINPALPKLAAEIDAAKSALQATLDEIAATADRLTSLRVHEQSIRDKIAKLESDKRTISLLDQKVKAKNIEVMVQQDEDKIRKLQAELEHLMAHREQAMSELTAVQHFDDGVIAGAPGNKTHHNVSVARYELKAGPVLSGLSHDPLAQNPVDGVNEPVEGRAWPARHEPPARTILDIGVHSSASPYVNPKDYVIESERPRKEGEQSAKFSDWRSPSRSSTRIVQPPGGYSHMNHIFG